MIMELRLLQKPIKYGWGIKGWKKI